MSSHRRSVRRTKATRAATAVGALAATASIALTSPGVANAAAPNYGQVTSDLSHALDGFLDGTNTFNNSVWNPIAGKTGGLLPLITSSYSKNDLTDLSDLSKFTKAIRDIVSMEMPWSVPGTVPNIVLPGGTTINLQSILPSQLPGSAVITDVTKMLDGVLGIGLATLIPGLSDVPGIGNVTLGTIIGETGLPPLGDLIKGLEVTHSAFESDFDWGPIASGNTKFQNLFVQTPAELILDLTSIEALDTPLVDLLTGLDLGGLTGLDTSINELLKKAGITPDNVNLSELLGQDLPSATVWVPQGSGNYSLLGASAGWWAAAPTANVAFPAILGATDPFDLTVSIPITSVGASLPFNLASVGNINTTVLMPLDNGVFAPLSLTVSNLNTAFGFGVTNVNISSNNYVGTDGINLNNGQNVLILQNPFLPIPIVYSLGGFNIGPNGAGLYMPSLFGVSLLPNIQLGTPPDVDLGLPFQLDDALDTLGLGALLNNPLAPTSLINLSSFIPGVNGLITDGEGFLTPFYLNTIGALLNPLSSWAGDQFGPVVDGTGNNLLKLSDFYTQLMEKLGGAVTDTVGPATDDATSGATTEANAPEAPILAARSVPKHELNPDNSNQVTVQELGNLLTQSDDAPSQQTPSQQTPSDDSGAPQGADTGPATDTTEAPQDTVDAPEAPEVVDSPAENTEAPAEEPEAPVESSTEGAGTDSVDTEPALAE